MVDSAFPEPVLDDQETQVLLDWAANIDQSDATYFQTGQLLATRLGAHYREDGLTEIGFWTPGLAAEVIQSERSIYLEVFTPLEPIDFQATEQEITWQRDRIPLILQGEYIWGVIKGLRAGTREQAGSFYWLRYIDNQGHVKTTRDPLAYSLPYGVFAPAELYDSDQLQRQRADLGYFKTTGAQTKSRKGFLASDLKNPPPRLPAPVCILQLHIHTASPEGTLAGLTRIYQRISDKLSQGEDLTPIEQNYVGYDAIELLPIEPTIEYRLDQDNHHHEFFARPPEPTSLTDEHTQTIQITLRKPNTQNWGYDVPIIGSAATNPAVLETLRPDETIDFIATLHNFSTGPIQVIYDLVYGHADNQCEKLISRQYLKGPNMYGQDLNHQLPAVRAVLLEMQRRKNNTGADGIRVDGGQDFRFFNPLTNLVEQDDGYLRAMGNIVQEIEGNERLMFTIFEDGRPWPQEGWEETSRYLELVELEPHSYQWGPLVFAHNTPALQHFWDQKWRRVCEVMFQGSHWITGCANHDTVRRGNQIDPNGPINWHLGDTLVEVTKTAYDNPAIKLWVLGFCPGLPMEFLNANFRGAWGFFRNTDELYGVKVVSEEIGFLDWQLTPELFQPSEVFPQLKALGFTDLEMLRQFAAALQTTMLESDYNLEIVADLCRRCFNGDSGVCANLNLESLKYSDRPAFLNDLDVPKLKQFARAFMEDGYDFSNVKHWGDSLDPDQVAFNLAARQYRFTHPWLGENLTERDRFNRITEDAYTLFYGHRTQHDPDIEQPEDIVMVSHMGGEPATVTLGDWLQLELSEWRVALTSPGLEIGNDVESLRSFELKDTQGVLLEKIV